MFVAYKEGVTGSSPVAPTHKTPGQRPKPRSADETNGLFLGLGAPLGHRRNRLCDVIPILLWRNKAM